MDRLGPVWRLIFICSVIWIPRLESRNPGESISAMESPKTASNSRSFLADMPRYKTAYACEGKTLQIECKDGQRIHLIRANYGRFSITICNDHGNIDWSVDCMSHKSLQVLHNRCSNNQNCSILASTSIFGDPCIGTRKYLEAHYQCRKASATTTTSRPIPPWLITSQPPSVWSTLKPTPHPPVPSHVTTESTVATSDQTSASVQTATKKVNTGNANTLAPPILEPDLAEDDINDEDVEEQLPKMSPPVSTSLPSSSLASSTPLATTLSTSSHGRTTSVLSEVTDTNAPRSPIVPWYQENESCSPVTIRNLHWNWTRVGELVVQPCPGGATGLARWRCIISPSLEPSWSPETPDLSECRSVWLTSLESRIIEGDSLIAITGDLATVTSSKTLYGGDMMITTKIIMKMAQKMANDIQSFPDTRQREAIVTELLSGVVRTGSNLLDIAQHPSWKDLGHKEQMQVATLLLIGLEENAFLLADTVIREKTVIQTMKNIMLSVRVLETQNIGTETFPRPGLASDQWHVSNDWVQLPRSALQENSEGGLVRLVFVAFDRLEEILEWNAESYEQNGRQNISRVLNSKVISASLGKGRHIQLSEPIRLSMRHLKTENVSNPSCVFWDYTMSAWSEEGCRVESTNLTHTLCQCDHLTNFAILMDVHMTYLPPEHQIALQIITYVGCIVSIISLVLAIFTFCTFKGLKSDRTTIHTNLCVCLLIAEVLFVAGINQTEYPIICSAVAGLLQLFLLCAFAWMFLEGFQLYVMLVEVFEAEKSRARWYYLFAYGVPLLIVSIALMIDRTSYGTSRYCWLRANNLFIFTFITPVVIVILANLVFLGMAIYIMCRHANASISMKTKEHSRLASARIWLRGAIALVVILGFTWFFGLLYLNAETVYMAYIFTILNAFQGLFIFTFHCVQNEKVRKEYRKLIRRHSWLPRCLRCSKLSSSSGSSDGGRSGGGRGGGAGAGDNSHTGTVSLCKEARGGCLYTAGGGGAGGASNGSPVTHANENNAHASSHTSQAQHYSLQRGWSSRSCNTIGYMGGGNNGGGNSNINNCRFSSNKKLTDSPSSNDKSMQDYLADDRDNDGHDSIMNNMLDHYEDDMIDNPHPAGVNTATLPYIKSHNSKQHIINSCCSSGDDDNNPNLLTSSSAFPKSATTWGPLNKSLQWKNISSKSYSRDSGHGESEQENSPRIYNAGTSSSMSNVLQQRHNNLKNSYRKPFLSSGASNVEFYQYSGSLGGKSSDIEFYQQQQAAQAQLADMSHHQIQHIPSNIRYNYLHQHKKNNGANSNLFRTVSPWNHTYTEIHDSRLAAAMQQHAQSMIDDPVYEEIDRSEIQVSDMSDEDVRRQSDMSRQSSRSYGDHRPLIPYSPAVERNVQACIDDLNKHRMAAAVSSRGSENARSLAAVLDGQTVVCHLEPPEMYPSDSYSARTVVLPPYTEC